MPFLRNQEPESFYKMSEENSSCDVDKFVNNSEKIQKV